MTKEIIPILHEAIIASKIVTIRGENVILDVHLAELYEVETRSLKQAVRRNKDRFPDDFIYELSVKEIEEIVSQNVIPSRRHFGGAVPFAFTENGVAMLSGVLKSKRAVDVNIAIMRTFTILRKMLLLHKDVLQEIDRIKRKLLEQDNKFLLIFEYLKQFEEAKQQKSELENRKRIGFRKNDK
jgi:hypothetical protein